MAKTLKIEIEIMPVGVSGGSDTTQPAGIVFCGFLRGGSNG